MNRRYFVIPLMFVLLGVPAPARAAQPGTPTPPVITLGGSTVGIAPVTPRGRVFVYGFSTEPRGWMAALVRRATYLTDSGAGAVQWVIDKPISNRSVWFAIDFSSGLTATAYPDGLRAARFELTEKNLRQGISGDVEQLALIGYSVDFAVVRPGEGAWARYVHWDAAQDAADEHGTVRLNVYDLLPIAGTTAPPPKKLKHGDVVLMTAFSFTTRYAIGVVK